MDRYERKYVDKEKAAALLDAYMTTERPIYALFDFGDGLAVEVQHSPILGTVARTAMGKWYEPWHACSRDDVLDLLEEVSRYRPIMGDHVRADTEYRQDHHARDPLHFAKKRVR